jgi:hypothetical protein
VDPHRDQKNSLLFDSVYFFGNHQGGELILPTLGIAYTGLQGYSFHGPFRILMHAIGQFSLSSPAQHNHEALERYSVALWSRASTFSAVARHSAASQPQMSTQVSPFCHIVLLVKYADDYLIMAQIFSAREYWLPLYQSFEYQAFYEKIMRERAQRRRR